MNELFAEVKAFKGGDVGIQIDIFGNCYLHRALPVYDDCSHLQAFINRSNAAGKAGDKPEMIGEKHFVCVHA